jgi:hypothetical protein
MRFVAHGYVVAAREMCLLFLDNRLQASELMRRLAHGIERLCRFNMVMVPVISGPTLECLRLWRRLSSFMYLSMPSRSLMKDASATSILEKRATLCGKCLEGMIVTWVSLSSF